MWPANGPVDNGASGVQAITPDNSDVAKRHHGTC